MIGSATSRLSDGINPHEQQEGYNIAAARWRRPGSPDSVDLDLRMPAIMYRGDLNGLFR